MNSYQKLGTFLCRLTGSVVLTVGSAGLLYAGVLVALHVTDERVNFSSGLGSLAWVVMGSILVLSSRPLGRILGRGLDDGPP